jgi:hypothetical protein
MVIRNLKNITEKLLDSLKDNVYTYKYNFKMLKLKKANKKYEWKQKILRITGLFTLRRR